MAATWPGAELELLFTECPEASLFERETTLKNSLCPLINSLRRPSSAERRVIQRAFTRYYKNAIRKFLNDA
jgi:hypothetical protein